RRYKLAKSHPPKLASDDRGNVGGQAFRMALEQPPDLRYVAQYCLDREVFVMKPEYRFDHMRERAVTYVVEKSRHSDRQSILFRYLILSSKAIDNTSGEMQCPQAVREAGMLGGLIRK